MSQRHADLRRLEWVGSAFARRRATGERKIMLTRRVAGERDDW